MVGRNCSVRECMSTTHTNKNLKFHRFPRDDRIPAWIEACRRPELRSKSVEYMYKNKCICSLHFEKFMYNKRNLLRGAVPTLKLPKMLLQEIEVQSKVLPNIMTGDSPSKRKLDIATEILNEWDDTTREDFLQDTTTPQPSTSNVVETKIVENNKKVGIKKKPDTKTKVEMKRTQVTKKTVEPKKKNDTNKKVEMKKKQNTKTNVELKKKITIKTETPSKGEIDIIENPPEPYKSTKTYVKNKSRVLPIAFEEDIKPDIKAEIEITENGMELETEIKIETEASVDRDQMQIFANTVALQLNNLPLAVAVNVQVKIQKLIVDESIKYFNSLNNGKERE